MLLGALQGQGKALFAKKGKFESKNQKSQKNGSNNLLPSWAFSHSPTNPPTLFCRSFKFEFQALSSPRHVAEVSSPRLAVQ